MLSENLSTIIGKVGFEKMHSTVIQIEVTIVKEELFAHSLAKLHPSSHGAHRSSDSAMTSNENEQRGSRSSGHHCNETKSLIRMQLENYRPAARSGVMNRCVKGRGVD